MALREREGSVDTPLEVRWQWVDGDLAVWEVEHLFGYDVIFGNVLNGRYFPVRWITRDEALDDFERGWCRRAVIRWGAGDWAVLQRLMADFAARG
jgi:hypothetical protein